MHLDHLWLQNFRNYLDVELTFPTDGLTVIEGKNGQGKTNLIEAVGYVATLRSFRGATPEVMVAVDSEDAIVRGEGIRAERALLVECEISKAGRSRTLVNRQALKRSRDLSEAFLVTVFSPDDLVLVKQGPAERRRYLDELFADSDPKMQALQRDLDRILRQRNTLLRQAGGRATTDITTTLDVWDAKFTEAGEQLGDARERLTERLQPHVSEAYLTLAESPSTTSARVGMKMSTDWRTQDGGKGLSEALAAARSADIARGVTTIGPHRDELTLTINGLPARTHASQGEQRTLSLALRLASHRVLQEVADAPPILLLDDVFSELDDDRCRRLVQELPAGQAFLTTATSLPSGIEITNHLRIEAGRILS